VISHDELMAQITSKPLECRSMQIAELDEFISLIGKNLICESINSNQNNQIKYYNFVLYEFN